MTAKCKLITDCGYTAMSEPETFYISKAPLNPGLIRKIGGMEQTSTTESILFQLAPVIPYDEPQNNDLFGAALHSYQVFWQAAYLT